MSKSRRSEEISRREFIEGSSAAALGLLVSSCSGDEGGQGDADDPGDAGDSGDADVRDSDTMAATDADVLGDAASSDAEGDWETELTADPYDDRRVVRVYDRRLTDYSFDPEEICWQHIDGDVQRQMLDAALQELARAEGPAEAWHALLPGDLATARIAVKINLNGAEPYYVNTSPAMMIALAESLIEAGAVAGNLTFFDVSRTFHEEYRDVIDDRVPGVVLQGGGEVPLHDTLRIVAETMVRADTGDVISSRTPTCMIEADHIINLHVFKGHRGGSTGAMKNLFGVARDVYSTFHGRGDWGLTAYAQGKQCADLATFPLIREKSRLLISEGAYGTWWHADKPPDRFRNEDLFPDGLPCTLVASRNPLYHDTVLYDLINAEREYEPLDEGYSVYPDDWLRFCSEPPYNLGDFAHGWVVDGTFTPKDMAFPHIDYRSFSTQA